MRCVWRLPRRQVSIQTSLNPVYMLCITFHYICVFFSFSWLFSLCFFISFPSADCCEAEKGGETFCGRYEFEDAVFSVKRGDYSFLMEKVCQNLEKAKVWQRSTWKKHWIIDTFGCEMNSMTFEVWVMFFSFLFFFLRLMQPMRTRRRCWKSIFAVSPMALWKPTKKGPVTGLKTKDLLWRGVWPIFNMPVTFYTKPTEQTLSLRVGLKLTKPNKSNSTNPKRSLCLWLVYD